MNKSLRRTIRRICKDSRDESTIGTRSRMMEALQSKAENGQVAIYVWQMDCDCSSWSYHDVLPAKVFAIDQYIDQVYANAEGEVRWYFVKPSEVPEKEEPSRDHLLEAFEDGHPHYITY